MRRETWVSAGPITVHVVHGADYYRASWNGRGRVTLSSSSLSWVRGARAFAGFVRGEEYLVAVGCEAPGGGQEKLQFAPMWVAKVNVAK